MLGFRAGNQRFLAGFIFKGERNARKSFAVVGIEKAIFSASKIRPAIYMGEELK